MSEEKPKTEKERGPIYKGFVMGTKILGATVVGTGIAVLSYALGSNPSARVNTVDLNNDGLCDLVVDTGLPFWESRHVYLQSENRGFVLLKNAEGREWVATISEEYREHNKIKGKHDSRRNEIRQRYKGIEAMADTLDFN